MHFSYIASLALLAQGALASLSVEDICSYTLPSGKETGATICLRGDQALEFPKEVSGTAKLGATGIQLCCAKGGICLLSDEAEPEVLCYDPARKKAGTHSNVFDCDLKDGKCGGKEGMFTMSTEGVQTVTSVVDGEGFTGESSEASPSSSAATPSGTSKPSGAAALAVSGDMGGLLMVGFMAAVGGTLAL